jgi:hypothetical protein
MQDFDIFLYSYWLSVKDFYEKIFRAYYEYADNMREIYEDKNKMTFKQAEMRGYYYTQRPATNYWSFIK